MSEVDGLKSEAARVVEQLRSGQTAHEGRLRGLSIAPSAAAEKPTDTTGAAAARISQELKDEIGGVLEKVSPFCFPFLSAAAAAAAAAASAPSVLISSSNAIVCAAIGGGRGAKAASEKEAMLVELERLSEENNRLKRAHQAAEANSEREGDRHR